MRMTVDDQIRPRHSHLDSDVTVLYPEAPIVSIPPMPTMIGGTAQYITVIVQGITGCPDFIMLSHSHCVGVSPKLLLNCLDTQRLGVLRDITS